MVRLNNVERSSQNFYYICMMKDKFQLGDAVYIPSEDPEAQIIYTIVARSKEYARLYHPTEPAKVLPMSQIEAPLVKP